MNSLRIQDSSLNGVWVFLCLWTLGEFSTYKTPISTESECSCVFGHSVWVLYVSSGSILETSPSLGTRPPTTLAWLFPCSTVSPIEWLLTSDDYIWLSPYPLQHLRWNDLLCFPDLSSSRSNTGTYLNYTSCDLCEKVKTWEGYLKIHIKISTQLYKAHI